jgi:hypothetical protein
VLTLLLILLVVGVTVTVLLWVGTLFLQGYYYTEPTKGILWQAPAAGAALTIFLVMWCFLVANSATATTQDIPYDTLFRFSPQVEMFRDPVRELWAVHKGKGTKEVLYKIYRTPPNQYGYKKAGSLSDSPLTNLETVEAILIKGDQGDKIRFTQATVSEGSYDHLVSDDGWQMKWYHGPTGLPFKFRWGRFLLTFFLNSFHLVLWFACLWLLLRFQWGHALGLAIVLWLVMTLTFMPMLLTQAAQVAQERRTSAGAAQGTPGPSPAVMPTPGCA